MNSGTGFLYKKAEQSTDNFLGMAEPQLCCTFNGQVTTYSKAELSSQSFPDGKVLLTGFRSSAASLGEQSWSPPKCSFNLHRQTQTPPLLSFLKCILQGLQLQLSQRNACLGLFLFTQLLQRRLKPFLLCFSSHNHLFLSVYQKGRKMNKTLKTTNQI